MHKKKSIIKLSLLSLVLVIGLLFSFVQLKLPNFYNYNSFLKSFDLSADLSGGVYAVYDIDAPEDVVYPDDLIESAKHQLTNLFKNNGYNEVVIMREGDAGLRIKTPITANKSDEFTSLELLGIVGAPAKLTFEVGENILLTGDDLKSATAETVGGSYTLKLTFTDEGKEKFAEATGENYTGETMNIMGEINGEKNPLSSFTISDPITDGVAYITGNYTRDSVRSMVFQIMSGLTGIQLKLIDSGTFAPELGNGSNIAMFVILLCVFLIALGLCAYRYRGLAIGSAAGSLFALVLLLFIYTAITSTRVGMPAIGAMMTVCALMFGSYIIMFERIRDDYANGKSLVSSVHGGYRKSMKNILEMHILSFAISVAMYFAGSLAIKNFAFTMIFGSMISLFTVALVAFFVIKEVLVFSEDPEFYNFKRGQNVVEVESANENKGA